MTRLRAAAKALTLLGVAGLLNGMALGMARGHEFWIAPISHTVDVGAPLQAALKNGDNFKGPSYPFVGAWFSRFEVHGPEGMRPVAGQRGDSPALNMTANSNGLHVVAYASTMYSLTYDSFEEFASFARSKKQNWVLEAHEARGLPGRVTESYYRYPKALIKVGDGAGKDRQVGLPLELVAETNPYSEEARDGVRVRLYLEGAPYPGADLQIFHFRGDETKAVKAHVTTDETGRALIPLFDGGRFLINATLIRPPRPEGIVAGAMWESLWASMTYEVLK